MHPQNNFRVLSFNIHLPQEKGRSTCYLQEVVFGSDLRIAVSFFTFSICWLKPDGTIRLKDYTGVTSRVNEIICIPKEHPT